MSFWNVFCQTVEKESEWATERIGQPCIACQWDGDTLYVCFFGFGAYSKQYNCAPFVKKYNWRTLGGLFGGGQCSPESEEEAKKSAVLFFDEVLEPLLGVHEKRKFFFIHAEDEKPLNLYFSSSSEGNNAFALSKIEN